MAKKFKKVLFLAAVIGTAAAAAHYYLQKKDSCDAGSGDEDYDDFSEEEDTADCSRSYVPLNAAKEETPAAEERESAEKKNDSFTPLKETAAQNSDPVENVEEFFDEEDAPGEEPPLTDN